jgi:hypothetical protein
MGENHVAQGGVGEVCIYGDLHDGKGFVLQWRLKGRAKKQHSCGPKAEFKD